MAHGDCIVQSPAPYVIPRDSDKKQDSKKGVGNALFAFRSGLEMMLFPTPHRCASSQGRPDARQGAWLGDIEPALSD